MLTPLVSALHNQDLIITIIKEIMMIVEKEETEENNCGLLSGLSGKLLFLFKLNAFEDSLSNEDLFAQKLDFLQEQLSSYINQPDLSRGLSGQGWFLEFINQAQAQGYDPELCEEIDNILINTIAIDTWNGEIEMVLGLSGIGMYAGRRIKKSTSSLLFESILTHFESLAIKTSDNILSWSQPSNSVYRFNKDKPEELEFNLGLAHGVPGIIASLLPALNIPSLHQRTKSLLVQSCDWLIEQEVDVELRDENCSSYFGSYRTGYVITDKKKVAKSGSRLGWCYGDLTIALTLARVGNALELPSYIAKAKEIGLHAALRDKENAAIFDAGLCHGSAGLALIFQLLYQQVQESEFLMAADKWLKFTLDMYQEKGIKGLYTYSHLTNEYEKETGLLMGLSGIGLCLLSALGQEADWADSLLMA